MNNISKQSKRILAGLVAGCLVSAAHAANYGRTTVVHLSTYDSDKTTNALLFTKHSCQFHPDADSTTMRLMLTNDAVLNAIKDTPHPTSNIPTLPDDDPKTANHLMQQLLGIIPSDPALRCNVEIAVTGPGLKKLGKTPADMYPGIRVGGAKPTSDPGKVQVPVFMTVPASGHPHEPIIVIDW